MCILPQLTQHKKSYLIHSSKCSLFCSVARLAHLSEASFSLTLFNLYMSPASSKSNTVSMNMASTDRPSGQVCSHRSMSATGGCNVPPPMLQESVGGLLPVLFSSALALRSAGQHWTICSNCKRLRCFRWKSNKQQPVPKENISGGALSLPPTPLAADRGIR